MARTRKPRAGGVAAALLDAHVAFLIEQLCGRKTLPALLDGLLDTALDHANRIALESVVTRAMIRDTARTWAVELDLRGGIPELVGDVARALHAHPIHQRTRLADLLSQRRFEEMLDHVLSLRTVRRRLVTEVIESPLYERIASELLYNGIRDYLARGSAVPAAIPGVRSAMKLGRAVVGRAAAGLEGAVEDGIKRHIGRSVGQVSRQTAQALIDGAHDADLREAALDSWARLRELRVGELREDLSALDVEELFVTLYEAWKELRGTAFYAAMIDAGIDAFFDKYGTQTLGALLEDLGIDRARMLDEALRFAPHVLVRLHAEGHLEPLLRAALAPFYDSGAVERVLDGV